MNPPFLIADLHLGHKKVVEFTNYDGTKMRPWNNIDEMNEALIGKWNNKVGPKDKVYLLGDALFGNSNVHLFSRLNGDKILILGNHDLFDLNIYLTYFRAVRASWPIGDFIMTHIPLHPQSVSRWKSGNIHGHLHSNRVLGLDGKPDKRYICVSVEHTGFEPVSFNEIEKFR